MPRRLRTSVIRWFLAQVYYLQKPIVAFLPTLALLVGFVVFGAVAFHVLHPTAPSLAKGAFITYCLMFGEHLLQDFPDHWLLQAFYVIMPILGVVVFLDGIVRFSYHVFSKDNTGKEWIAAVTKATSNHIILVGLGNVGFRILQELLKQDEEVVALERDAQSRHLGFARRNNVPVLIGNGREEGILTELNVASAKSIILATNDDLTNLELAIDARKENPNIRVVLRMFDQELATKVRESFDIKAAFSTSALAAPVFAISSTDRSVLNSFYVGDQLMVVFQMTINPRSKLVGQPISKLKMHESVSVLKIRTGNNEPRFFPDTQTTLQASDVLVVQSLAHHMKSIHALN